jgi:Ca2+-binding EF-hand superfamily protein
LLKSSYDFTSLDAFRSIDTHYAGVITLDALVDFNINNGVPLSRDEAIAFFRVVDTDEDGRITYSELLEALTMVPDFFKSSVIVQELRKSREME